MKLRTICKSKIHHATVTSSDVDYIGSIGIDQTLMELTDIVPGEQVAVWNVSSGARIETLRHSARPRRRRDRRQRRRRATLSARRSRDHRGVVQSDERVQQMIAVDEKNQFAIALQQ